MGGRHLVGFPPTELRIISPIVARRLAAWLLRPGGLFLNHGIATTGTGGGLRPGWLRFGDGGFVGRYVFPDGELVAIRTRPASPAGRVLS